MKKIVNNYLFLCYDNFRVDNMKNIKEVLKLLLVVAIIIPFCSFMLDNLKKVKYRKRN